MGLDTGLEILQKTRHATKHIEKRGDGLQVTRTIWETYAALANIAWLASRGRVMS
jgi:hypothetical protein